MYYGNFGAFSVGLMNFFLNGYSFQIFNQEKIKKNSIEFNPDSHILNFFLRSGIKEPNYGNLAKILTHRKTKTTRSKKFRYMGFMKRFNI